MLAGQVFPPPQLTSHWQELPQLTSPHALSVPWHVALHWPLPHVNAPQAATPAEHVSKQSPAAHVIAPHAEAPLHVRLQSVAPLHVRDAHAALPVQVMSQLAPEHVIAPHGAACEQVILHARPAGQSMGALLPVMRHVVPSQPPLQAPGHSNASGGNTPSTQ
jgi:hypothetical protein